MGQTRIIERRNLQLPNVSILRSWAESTSNAQIVAGPQRCLVLVFCGETGAFSGAPTVTSISLGGVAGTIVESINSGAFFLNTFTNVTVVYWDEAQLSGIGNINAAVAITSDTFDTQQFASVIYQNVDQTNPIAGSNSVAAGNGAITIPAAQYGEGGFVIIGSGSDTAAGGISTPSNYTQQINGTLMTGAQLQVYDRRTYSQYNQTQEVTGAGNGELSLALVTLNRSLISV